MVRESRVILFRGFSVKILLSQVTGAGDGSIQLFPLPVPRTVPTPITHAFPEDLLRLIDNPFIRKLAFLSSGAVVAATEDGTILKGNSKSIPWAIVCKDVRFSNYCVLSVAPSRTKFSIASLRGEVILYQCKQNSVFS